MPDPEPASAPGMPMVHPDAARWEEENSLLRAELCRLLAELDDLVQVGKPHLLALYQVQLGAWELRALEAEAECARLRRKLELVQSALNRGARPDPAAIACQLELEFAAWRQRLQDAADRAAAAATRLRHAASPAKTAEFRSLYRQLVKRLHPDANPGQDDNARLLWLRVQAAHRANDLEELRALALLAPSVEAASSVLASTQRLAAERARLSEAIARVLRQIETVRAEPPFTLEHQLGDETWLAARRQAVDKAAAEWRSRAAALRTHLLTLFPNHGQPAPGNN